MASELSGTMAEGNVAKPWRLWLASGAALVAAGLLVALVLLVGSSSGDRDADLDRERHSYEVVIITRTLDAAMARSEAALGRFVISGDRDTGLIYYGEWRRAGELLRRLRALVADDPQQSARVAELAGLYAARGKELDGPAVRANFRQGWTALSLFNEAGKSSTIPRIATLLRAIGDSEQATLTRRSGETARSTDRANSLAWLLSVLGLMLAVGAAVLGWAVIHALAEGRLADDAAQSVADRADALEEAVALRTRELSNANARLLAEAETRAAAEAQLRQIQKMEAVGQLTGGIAHDFNNMLSVVVGGLDLARRRLPREAAEIGRYLDSAMEGATRAAALTRRLLAFARAEPLLPEGLAPARLIAGMADLIDRTLGERIRVETRLDASAWQVWCDPSQLENAILNLAVNGRDAMDGEGQLLITTEDVVLAAGAVGDAPAGDYVRIAVTDSGSGMAPEVVERVFEPFFTTKPVGKGTGLGLSQVFSFIRQTGGEVAIRSAPGAGTTVSLYLPRHVGAAQLASVGTAAERAVERPAEKAVILVVEDDARVRAATLGALADLGHDPIAASGGEEALAILEARGDIRLIVSDVVMPGMTGPELIARATALYPETAVLYVTGYVGEAGDAGQLEGQAVLRKPFTVAALQQAVAAALARLPAVATDRAA